MWNKTIKSIWNTNKQNDNTKKQTGEVDTSKLKETSITPMELLTK